MPTSSKGSPRPPKTFRIVCEAPDEGRRLDQFIATRSGESRLSRNAVKKLIIEGSVSLNGELCADADRALKRGDAVEILKSRETPVKAMGQKIPFGVLYEDNHILVIDKPAGLVVHPGAGNARGTLANALVGTRRKLSDVGGAARPGIVHRLDKDTSGILLVAKTNRAHRALAEAFGAREVHKEYAAIVRGRVERMEGRIDLPVGRDRRRRTQMTASNPEFPREATTFYKVEERLPFATLVTLRPTTGRTHQIRVHLAALGHPVMGDPIYGTADEGRLALHAKKISFEHPATRKTVAFESPLPDDLVKRLKRERVRTQAEKP